MDKKKRMPIGVDSFEKIRTGNFYYVDKTEMIHDILENGGEVNLFTRPRRFGKSLIMSMLKCFFEIGSDKSLFDHLAIAGETKLCEEHMGKYPVISISLKTAHGTDFEQARSELCTLIGEEAKRFSFLLESGKLSGNDKLQYRQLIRVDDTGKTVFALSDAVLTNSLKQLSYLLHKHYGCKVILLIDEYDVPLAKADAQGYYSKMTGIIRNMFDAVLKSNADLAFAVMTGCLRVSKESIFTGLNNLKMYTLLDAECDEQFGFTDDEVRQMLECYNISEYYELTKIWYDGYIIGEANVYNPWDVINWCNQLLTGSNRVPKSYWANTSSNTELRRFIHQMGDGVAKAQMERLISGESVQKEIREQLTYDSMYDSIENMWSLLFATGYLTQDGMPAGNLVRLAIPNEEIRGIFKDSILEMFHESIAKDGADALDFCEALKNGDSAESERLFNELIKRTASIRDTSVRKEFKENFYHGLLLGILSVKGSWDVESNREAGDGYPDIAIEIDEGDGIGLIIEVKYAGDGRYDKAIAEALRQIDEKGYTQRLEDDDMSQIFKVAVACYKKRCRIVMEESSKGGI